MKTEYEIIENEYLDGHKTYKVLATTFCNQQRVIDEWIEVPWYVLEKNFLQNPDLKPGTISSKVFFETFRQAEEAIKSHHQKFLSETIKSTQTFPYEVK